jgi:hypothetical protein
MTINKIFTYFFVLLTSIIGIQGKSTRNSASQKELDKSIYIEQFKLTYFRQMLIKGYNNSNAIQEVINFDHSGFTEPILTIDDYKLIDSLTSVDNQKMRMDSTRSIGRRAEGAVGKRPLGFILEKLESKWIDSIANEQYKSSGAK